MCIFSHAQPAPRPAVLAARPDLVPQPADLPGARPAAARAASMLPLRAEAGRVPVPRAVRERRAPPELFAPVDKKHRLFARGETMAAPGAPLPLDGRSAASRARRATRIRARGAHRRGRGARARAARPLRAGLASSSTPPGRSSSFSPRTGTLPGARRRRAERRRPRAWRARACARTCAPRSTRPCRRGRPCARDARSPWRRTASPARSTWWCSRATRRHERAHFLVVVPGARRPAAGRATASALRPEQPSSEQHRSSSRASCARPRSTCRRRSRRSRPRTRS